VHALVISSWWTDAKQVIIQNLTESRLAKFRQLAKLCATFVWKFPWRVRIFLRLDLLSKTDFERSAASRASKCP